MATKTESSGLLFVRSLAGGVLLSMLLTYAAHVFGTWSVENYRPDADTTYTVLLHNKCALFGNVHTLRPNTDVSTLGSGVDGTKLGGSFLIFFEGHLLAMALLALVLGGSLFLLRKKTRKTSS